MEPADPMSLGFSQWAETEEAELIGPEFNPQPSGSKSKNEMQFSS